MKQAEALVEMKRHFLNDLKSKISLVRDLTDAERDLDNAQTRVLNLEEQIEKVSNLSAVFCLNVAVCFSW